MKIKTNQFVCRDKFDADMCHLYVERIIGGRHVNWHCASIHMDAVEDLFGEVIYKRLRGDDGTDKNIIFIDAVLEDEDTDS